MLGGGMLVPQVDSSGQISGYSVDIPRTIAPQSDGSTIYTFDSGVTYQTGVNQAPGPLLNPAASGENIWTIPETGSSTPVVITTLPDGSYSETFKDVTTDLRVAEVYIAGTEGTYTVTSDAQSTLITAAAGSNVVVSTQGAVVSSDGANVTFADGASGTVTGNGNTVTSGSNSAVSIKGDNNVASSDGTGSSVVAIGANNNVSAQGLNSYGFSIDPNTAASNPVYGNLFVTSDIYTDLASVSAQTGVSESVLMGLNPSLPASGTYPAGTVFTLPAPDNSQAPTITINPDPQPQTQVQGENTAAQNTQAGYISNSATSSIGYNNNTLNNTDSVSTTEAGLASDGVRPGAVQDDPNVATNDVLANIGSSVLSGVDALAAIGSAAASQASNVYIDPLLLDLGRGIVTTSYQASGVLFDVDDSGTLHQTGWAAAGTGMLVLPGTDGQITSMSEIFSPYFGGTLSTNGGPGAAPFTSGMAALASFDSNHDGVIDANDPIFSQLRVWVDSTGPGTGELLTLAELGITSINLNATGTRQIDNGNIVTAVGSFVMNGQTQTIEDVDFVSNPAGSTFVTSDGGVTATTTSGNTTVTTFADTTGQDLTLDATALGVDNIYAGAGNDTLIASANGSWLVGGTGNDTFVGGAGNDVFVVSANDNPANIHGNGGVDTLIVTGSQGMIINMAQEGVTIAEGGGGNDVIMSGGRTGVYIKGGTGNDTLIGGAGTDVIVGGSGHNLIIGGTGQAEITAGPNGDTIYASAGGSIINAGAGADQIYGGAGDDLVKVGMGNAVIDGGGGTNMVQFTGNYSDYRIVQVPGGYWIADTVPNRNGTVFVTNVQELNFADIQAVRLDSVNPMPVNETLSTDAQGADFDHLQPHLISSQQLLVDALALGSVGPLHITSVSNAVGGTVSLTAAGDVLFTPDSGFNGVMSFQYTIADSQGNVAASVQDLSTGQTAQMQATVTLQTPDMPADPALASEWYLQAANVLPVWQDYTGKGVTIGQFEPSGSFAVSPEIFDYEQPDLAPNVNQTWLSQQEVAGTLPSSFSEHATMVAGVMVGARNGQGMVGVAYDATLAGYALSNDDVSNLGMMASYDIANNSWDVEPDFVEQSGGAFGQAILQNALYTVAHGRSGLGTIIVEAAGNNRTTGGTAEGSVSNNNRFSIEVGAINSPGDLATLDLPQAPFSNPGASILVSAPGSDIASTSQVVVTDGGGLYGDGTQSMQGTSFATPIVSGIVALMLEANPNLGYRDVQAILALSATQVTDPATSWTINGATNWNGGGMHVSNDYGFGEVDALAAVRLAETWLPTSTIENEYSTSASYSAAQTVQPGQKVMMSVNVAAGVQVEHVEVNLNLSFGQLSDVTVTLIAPDGTQSVLLANNDPGSTLTSLDTTLMSTHDWGEQSAGTWSLSVTDNVTGAPVSVDGWTLNVYGASAGGGQTYVYTNEYASEVAASPARATLVAATGGIDTINAAALSGDVSIDLLTGQASLGGTALTIQDPQVINNLFAGDGNDTLTANNNNDILDGGRGTNTLVGGAGDDLFVVRSRDTGGDTIVNFNPAQGETIDLVGFDGLSFADLQFVQQGADVRVLGLGTQQTLLIRNVQVAQLCTAQFTFQDTFSAPQSYTTPTVQLTDEDQTYNAGDGDVIVRGGAGTDIIIAGAGNDTLIGGSGNALLAANSGDDVLKPGTGFTYMQGGTGATTFYLEGEDAFNNTLTVNGTVFSAIARAGSGVDRFVLDQKTAGSGLLSNTVVGFDVNNDVIDLSEIAQATDLSTLNFSTISINGEQFLGISIKGDPLGRKVTLEGITAAQLSATNFVFAPAPLTPSASQSPQVAGTSSNGFADASVIDSTQGISVSTDANGVVTEYAGIDAALPDSINHLVLTGAADIIGTANNFGDVLEASAGNDTLIGGAGNDVLIAGTGNDTLVGAGGINTYVIQPAGSLDTVETDVGQQDTLLLQGVPSDAVTLARQGNDLLVTILTGQPGQSQVLVKDQFNGRGIAILQTSDGILAASAVSAIAIGGARVQVTQVLGAQSAGAGSAFSYTLPQGLFASSVQGDALTWSASLADGTALPDWLTFDAATGQFSGTPPAGQSDALTLRVTASDMGGVSASTTLDLSVVVPMTTGRYVYIRKNDNAGTTNLAIAELQIWGVDGTDLAPGGTVSSAMPQDYGFDSPANINDGTTATASGVFATHDGLAGGWVQIDLGSSQAISSLDIWGRTDQWAYQSGNYTVIVSNVDLSGLTVAQAMAVPGVSVYVQNSQGPTDVVVTQMQQAPTGAVSVSGDTMQGQMLTASNTLADSAGLGTISYQWQSSNDGGQTWTNITGATDASYTLQAAQNGLNVRVVASYVNGLGAAQSVSSHASALVAPETSSTPVATGRYVYILKNGSAGATNLAIAEAQVWGMDGTDLALGQLVTTSGSFDQGWSSVANAVDGSTATASGIFGSPDGYAGAWIQIDLGSSQDISSLDLWGRTDQWAYQDGNYTVFVSDVDMAGMTMDEAMAVQGVAVYQQDSQGSTDVSVTQMNHEPTGTVTINGAAVQGQTFTASNTLADADGMGPVKYHWQTSSDSGNTWIDAVDGNVPVNDLVRVQAVYTDGEGNVETVTSAATSPLAKANDSPAIAAGRYVYIRKNDGTGATNLTIAELQVWGVDGTDLALNQPVSSSGSNDENWSAASNIDDGLTSTASGIFGSPDGYAGAWIQIDLGASQDIASLDIWGRTDQWAYQNGNYTVFVSDVDMAGMTIAQAMAVPGVAVYVENGQGPTDVSVTQMATGVIPVTMSGTVTVSGSAVSGQTLVAANTLADSAGLGAISYQWQTSGDGGQTWTNIAGATGASYTLQAAQNGLNVRVVASYTNGQGAAQSAASQIALVAPEASAEPAATGRYIYIRKNDSAGATNLIVAEAQVWGMDGADLALGQSVTTSGSFDQGWSNAANAVDGSTDTVQGIFGSPDGYAGAWIQIDLGASQDISSLDIWGRTDQWAYQNGNYTVFVSDVDMAGMTMDEAMAVQGVAVYQQDSQGATSVLVTQMDHMPTGAVSVDGLAMQGQTLTASNTLADADGLGTVTYQWQLSTDGGSTWSNIAGATGASYTLQSGLTGKQVRAVASYTDGAGNTDSVASVASSPVQPSGEIMLTRDAGSQTVTENNTGAASGDIVIFGGDIASDQLWFSRSGDDLDVGVIGTSTSLDLKDWFLGDQYHAKAFVAGDGKVLDGTQVDALVQAMATYTPPGAGVTTLSTSVQSALAPVLAANWH